MRAGSLVAVSCALVLASCSQGPSLEDAAAELQKDTRTLETDDVFKNPLKELRILERPDKDIPCGDGRSKRVMRATANNPRPAEQAVDHHLTMAQTLMEKTLGLPAFGYAVRTDHTRPDEPRPRLIRGVKEELGVTITVEVRPDPPTWRIRGETSCLASRRAQPARSMRRGIEGATRIRNGNSRALPT